MAAGHLFECARCEEICILRRFFSVSPVFDPFMEAGPPMPLGSNHKEALPVFVAERQVSAVPRLKDKLSFYVPLSVTTRH